MKNKLLTVILCTITLSVLAPNIQAQPNIILIMADDLGYGDIGCYGSSYIQTPVLDKMAAEGIKFTDFHSNGSVCTPTRAALMTGNYQQRAGLEGVIYVKKEKRIYGLATEQITLAEVFKKGGYTTGMFGKWHLGYQPEYNPTQQGFDTFYGYVSGNVDYISHRDGINIFDWWRNTELCYDKGYVTDLITDEALNFMEVNKESPFFLYLPHEAPHFPYQGRNDKADRLPGQDFEDKGSRKDRKAAYKEMVEAMDENIGRVFDKLKKLQLDTNTVVLFCSDNGATKEGSNGGLNGFKSSLFEGGHRVPAIAWYPSKIKAGTSDHTILSMDLLPTLAGIAAIELEQNVDGEDFSEVLLRQDKKKPRKSFWRYRNQWVAREGDWKYLKIKDREYLFNLEEDLGEQHDVKSEHPEKLQYLKTILAAWEKEMSQYNQQTK